MKRVFQLFLVVAMAVGALAAPLSASAADADSVGIICSNDGAEPQAVKILSVNDLKHYLSKYHHGDCPKYLDISKYDEVFFQEKFLLFTLVTTTGGSPSFEIAAVNETEKSIEIEMTRPEGPVSPDMASWILVIEMDRDLPDKEILVNSDKIADVPYESAPGHSFRDGVCTVCGAKKPMKFADVPAGAWYVSAVDYVSAHGLMCGISDDKFQPMGTMSRAMLVTVLWRFAGEPDEGTNTFTDIPENAWYAEAVKWAAKNDIVTGIGGNRFNPGDAVTREQMVTILFRFASKNGIETTARAEFSNFEDGALVHEYAVDAMKWAVAEKIITGSDRDGRLCLNPQGKSTRSQVATVLMRYLEN